MNVDGENHVLGRLATEIVENLKEGKEIKLFNADKVIVKGSPEKTVEKYRQKYTRGSRDHGPYFPKKASKIVKKTVEGMLPDNKEGRDMIKNLKTYETEPDEESEVFEEALEKDMKGSNFITMGEISERIGA